MDQIIAKLKSNPKMALAGVALVVVLLLWAIMRDDDTDENRGGSSKGRWFVILLLMNVGFHMYEKGYLQRALGTQAPTKLRIP